MFYSSQIEISRQAFVSNIRYLQQVIGPGVRFSSVIKGNAYGHGIENIVPMAEEAGIDHFSVFSANEALAACRVKMPKSGVMIMGYLDHAQVEWAVENRVEFFVFEMGRLQLAAEKARKLNTRARIHIEAETGFYRTGFEYSKLPQLIGFLRENQQWISLEGVCTHYAGAESISNYFRVKNQIALYQKFIQYFQQQGIAVGLRHTACSAAALTYPETIMDMVRFGIAQYGFWPSAETEVFWFREKPLQDNNLQRAISWKTRIMVLKEVDAGNFVGYGTSYLANKKIKIAIIPVGYANGFSRDLSNTGRVLIGGRRVPVIGIVTMNTMTVNVSDVPEVKVGDEVVLIGKQNDLEISVASFSEMSNELNYQLLTRLPADIPRVVVK